MKGIARSRIGSHQNFVILNAAATERSESRGAVKDPNGLALSPGAERRSLNEVPEESEKTLHWER